MAALDFVRAWSSKFFHRFGIHCATHQIRLILISGLVITSLFYPALGIYSDSVRNFPATSTSRFVGRLFGLNPQTLLAFQDDLDNVWSRHEALHVLDDTVARARCGTETTLRVERVLLTSKSFDSDAGAINHPLLLSTLQLETELSSLLLKSNLKCLSPSTRGCISLSPLSFWSHDEGTLYSDRNLLWTVNQRQNISISGLPLRASMVFGGRESAEPRSSTIDFASYLALTYLFHEDDCHSSNGHRAWLDILHRVAPSLGEVPRILQEPSLLTLEFNPGRKTGQRVPLITLTLYLSYIIFFVYFSGSMRRMDSVHSRVGLCFTGLVEILVSTITSLSVCAIFGLRITLVPWGIFPIVIVFVGAENMFRLIDDVTKTHISLPVKERIGIGLSRAGTSNTLKVVSYNSILGVIAFCAQGAIRQFCAFAIVVLVAHWFLIHTFFVAVLSIDIQRLELDDLLRQNTNPAPKDSKSADAKPVARVKTLSRIAGGVQTITKGRLAKNFSLMLLLVITATLYYSTLPGPSERYADNVRTPATRASVLLSKAEQIKLDVHTEARRIWRVFSTEDNNLVHLKIESPTMVVLDHRHSDATNEHRMHRLRWSARTSRLLWWICKVMVLPIGSTLTALYGLLLYLLKGTDQLENHRVIGDGDLDSSSAPIDLLPSFKTLPRAFASDVGLLASSRDGGVLVSVSSDGELFVWIAASRKNIQVDTTELVLRASASSVQYPLTAIAVDVRGTYFAVGAASGTIGVWTVDGDAVRMSAQLLLDDCASPVTQIEVSTSFREAYQHRPSTITCAQALNVTCILAVHANGCLLQWLNGVPNQCSSRHCGEVIEARLIHLPEATHPLACLFLERGGLEIIDVSRIPTLEGPTFIPAGSSEDRVVNAHACIVQIQDVPHVLIAAVTYSGVITLWDATTGDCISTLADTFGYVNNSRLIPVPSRACSQCGEVPLCSFSLVYSVGHIVVVDKGILARRCSCPLSQPLVSKVSMHKDTSLGRRSRSGSFVSSSGSDTLGRTRSRHMSLSNDNVSDGNAFPVSGHGMHSRRLSEKDASRRGSDKFDTPVFSALEALSGTSGDFDDHLRLTVPDGMTRPTTCSSDAGDSCLWRNLRLVRICEATCERGGWDILDGKILGIRRKPRKRSVPLGECIKQLQKNLQQTALSSSVLERWEIWMIDPSKQNVLLQASALSTLHLKDASPEADDRASAQKSMPRLCFTRLSPLVIRNSKCLAGFGNTIGMIDFNVHTKL